MELVRALCVDDEPQVLDSLTLHLRRGFEIIRAGNAAEGLAAMLNRGPFAVVLSDMRMPGMDGAAFLAQVKELSPETTRMLLTGYADIEAAAAAVNKGQVFRFLTKPCPPEVLRQAFGAAAEQYRLVTSERVLLEQTLLGSIKALTDILSMTSPLVFGKATRIRQQALELADNLGLKNHWALEVSAMLSQLGWITVPDEVVQKQMNGEALSPEEQTMLDRTLEITESLLANIPRLEPVRKILNFSSKPWSKISKLPYEDEGTLQEAAVLKVCADFDELETRGMSSHLALETLSNRFGQYQPETLSALRKVLNLSKVKQSVREIPLRMVSEGMVFAEDVLTSSGVLLVSRGFRVTAGFMARMRNFRKGFVKEPVRVIMDSQIR